MKIKLQIKSVFGRVLFEFEKENNTIKDTLLAAIKSGANLRDANLSGANLSDTDLRRANLSCANLSDANLSDANLSCANLSDAYLRRANLSDANLSGANLSDAYLRRANLSCADLSCANLWRANLSDADLWRANLRRANLSDTNLRRANLSCADLSCADLSDADLWRANLRRANLSDTDANEGTAMFFSQCPTEGSFVAWKKAQNKIVKIEVTEDAKRSSATTLKCRCSKAKVLEIQEIDGRQSDLSQISSNHDSSFIYKIGELVEVIDFDENRWNECSNGIHFFIDRNMAVKYK